MRFTFKAIKAAGGGYIVYVRRDGKLIAEVTNRGTRAEAVHAARIEAENYGYVDGVTE